MTVAPSAAGRFATRAELGDLVRLAWPVMVSRLGIMTMITVDTIVVGRFSATELAFLGLASILGGFMPVMAVGLLTGTLVMTSQAFGRGDLGACGRVWRRSLPYALLLGSGMAVFAVLGEPFFRLAGQDPAVAAGAVPVLAIYGLGMPALMIAVTSMFFLEGLKRPVPGMLVMVVANLVNLGLDLVLVWGWFGLPALGAAGSAWATTGVRCFSGAAMLAVVWWQTDHERLQIRVPAGRWWSGSRAERRLGFADGAARGLEYWGFGVVGLFAGLLGPLPLAAFTIVLTLLSLPFMAALGLAVATAVRVGAAWGRGDPAAARRAGWLGLGATLVPTGLVGLGFLGFAPAIAAGFTEDAALLAVVTPLIGFGATILLADGGQVVMSNALRGRGDAWVPTLLHFVSYFCVQIPLAALFAFTFDFGVPGLMAALLTASLVSLAILAARFHLLGRRDAAALAAATGVGPLRDRIALGPRGGG